MLLVEVKRLEFFISLVGSSCGVVDEELDHHAACFTINRSRAVGKGVVKVSKRLPLLHISGLTLLQLLQGAAVSFNASRVGSYLDAQRL